jgi:hypothetical protein
VKPTHAQPPQPTPVADDIHATAAQLSDRAAADYATGWGRSDVRATGNDPGSDA